MALRASPKGYRSAYQKSPTPNPTHPQPLRGGEQEGNSKAVRPCGFLIRQGSGQTPRRRKTQGNADQETRTKRSQKFTNHGLGRLPMS